MSVRPLTAFSEASGDFHPNRDNFSILYIDISPRGDQTLELTLALHTSCQVPPLL